ncbi:DM13 domain-containing protein [Deinococcus depolymerans]|uniref:DM13 domain-containing protein n=1 Tax=Deinococcus depolymerans TaxID=392408 RepID=A0ABN1BPG7_9DEIO
MTRPQIRTAQTPTAQTTAVQTLLRPAAWPTPVHRAALLSLALLGITLSASPVLGQTAAQPGHTMTGGAMSGTPTKGSAMQAGAMKTTLTGSFRALHAPTTGTVTLARNAQGRWTLTIHNLKTEPAPDLKVWLLAAKTVKDTPELRKEKYTDLGEIATTGTRTFLLPATFTPEQAGSVVLWCDQFSVAFAAATLK